jgi:hypothetical protein
LLLYFQEEGYLISFSSDNEDKWASDHEQQLEPKIPKGRTFSVVLVVEAVSNKLIKLRSPLQEFRWTGDWSHDSRLWDQKLK